MKFSLRLFLGYSLIIVLAGFLFYRELTSEIKPGMRQPQEETLVDVANLLAELVSDEVAEGSINQANFHAALDRFSKRRFDADIWSLKKRYPSLYVYITDAKGIVIFDSRNRDLGADYSRWNDVYLTLRGKYGRRSSVEGPKKDENTVMYVAAPVIKDGYLVGVLTVAKPNVSAQPFIDRISRTMLEKGIWVVIAALIIGLLLSVWLTISIRKLTRYAQEVRAGKRVEPPKPSEPELAQLAESMESMRQELEGKDYVERYLHNLTHELKSPLAAIQGASELLQEDVPEQQRQRFLNNIGVETKRMQQIVDRLLGLAVVEKRQALQQVEEIDMDALVQGVCEQREPHCQSKKVQLELELVSKVAFQGERFLLRQAIGNLLDNAIDFSSQGDVISVSASTDHGSWQLVITDQGPGIPEYAKERIFERFYSLPRPDNSGKSTGIGLAFVKEVMELHGGEVNVDNGERQGAIAVVRLPL